MTTARARAAVMLVRLTLAPLARISTSPRVPTSSATTSTKRSTSRSLISRSPSARPEDPGNPGVDFHGERRSNDTHQSTTDPQALLTRKGKGKESKLSYAGHVLMENRHGLAVNGCVTKATGRAEPQAAVAMVEQIPGWGRITLGADKGYDRREFVQELREHHVTPHFARRQSRIIDQRTTRHAGYAISQRKRKQVEEIFGWLKTVGGLRKTRHRGVDRVGWMFTFALAVYNLVRMRDMAAA